MYLRQMADEVSFLANDTTLGSSGTLYPRTKSFLRQAYFNDILPKQSDWWFLRRAYELQTVEEISRTVTVTKGSASATATSSISSVDGYMLVLDGHAQRISTTAGTAITFEKAWEHESVTGGSAKIVKDRYDLPAWLTVKSIREMKLQGARQPLEQLGAQQFSNYASEHAAINDPKHWTHEDTVRQEYSTGTVSGSINTTTLTGSSTAWTSSDLQEHDYIKSGNYAYRIKSVDSDTGITLYDALKETLSGASYTASYDRDRIRLYPFPKNLKNILITANDLSDPLQNDSDIPRLPEMYHWIMVRGAFVRVLKHNQDPGYRQEFAEYQKDILDLIARNNTDSRTDSWWQW